MNNVDYILLAVLLFYFWRGWTKGFLRALFGPVSFMLCFGYSWFYFHQTKNLIVSAVICILGPVILMMLLKGFSAVFKKARDKDEGDGANEPGFGNRLGGALINVSWMGLLFFLVLALFLMFPLKSPGLDHIRSAILESRSVGLLSSVLGNRAPFLKKGAAPIDLDKRAYLPELKKTPEYQQLMADKRVKELFENPETAKMIRNRDILGLFKDPRMREIMRDPKLIKQFLKLNQKMLEINQKQQGG